ncbi:MAG: undecaprenyl/decaprenyl-phosphate alpha-N-acetylglucosaminyl 1-phosphate transferase [Ardenticatenaceae bacterium]|nr:undecaprenyl/decaprenyl-phosphate alpha-N-acetylglucosaminyl 1-phosphate transferase [Anaerolineales bacterium]MCB8941104.1 undecaprenyl/decaprenyl-phosphate alpha-N-acetylglucosaminyl 1-phosphate transferase [Ardenticatenaceae bacterium]MCB8972445.1 undecaprenyl/decaprenyl-phosphate alpha-N-acetylglucosaminyl 1-phosphate transferase [Ardenticatenaceae bacterium]
MIYLLIFGVALGTAVLATPFVRKLAHRWGIVAKPGGRRQHSGMIAKLGGVPIMVGYLLGIVLIYLLIPPEVGSNDALRLRGVVLGSVVIFVGAFIDDRLDLKPRWQLAFQIAAAVIAMSHIIFIERFTNPLPTPEFWQGGFTSWFFTLEAGNIVVIRPFLVYIISLFWVLGMINAVNFLDGLDGLAGGVSTIAALMFALHSFQLTGQTPVTLFPLALAGALVGFLIFNFAPASIFLGTTGAWLLGYNLATLSILAPAKLSTALLVMAVPILDVAWLIVARLRRGQHPFQGDRRHLHFRLLDRGLPVRSIVLGYYGTAVAFGLVAIFVESRLLKIGLWLGLATAVLMLLAWLTNRTKRPLPTPPTKQ